MVGTQRVKVGTGLIAVAHLAGNQFVHVEAVQASAGSPQAFEIDLNAQRAASWLIEDDTAANAVLRALQRLVGLHLAVSLEGAGRSRWFYGGRGFRPVGSWPVPVVLFQVPEQILAVMSRVPVVGLELVVHFHLVRHLLDELFVPKRLDRRLELPKVGYYEPCRGERRCVLRDRGRVPNVAAWPRRGENGAPRPFRS